MKTSAERAEIAEQIIRSIDKRQLVECGCLATSAQIADIHKRAQYGEFDQYRVAIGEEKPEEAR